MSTPSAANSALVAKLVAKTRAKTIRNATKSLATFERDLSKMDPALAHYWRGSASYSLLERGSRGEFEIIVAD